MYKLFDPTQNKKSSYKKAFETKGKIKHSECFCSLKFPFILFSQYFDFHSKYLFMFMWGGRMLLEWKRKKKKENHKPRGIFVLWLCWIKYGELYCVISLKPKYIPACFLYMYLDIRMKTASTQHVLLLLASQYCCVVVLIVSQTSQFCFKFYFIFPLVNVVFQFSSYWLYQLNKVLVLLKKI